MKKTNSPQKTILKVSPRTITGKKVKKLRNQGLIPANIYGTDFKSQAVSVNFKDFIKAYKVAKETSIVYLDLEGKEIPALIKNVQKHPINDQILHIDFRKVDLKKKIITEVPVKIVGESPAVKDLGGVLLTQTETILVEALPEDIPQEIEVDISLLKEIGQEIKVVDLAKSEKYQIKTNADKVVVSVVAHKEESVAPDTTAVAPEVITEAKKAEEEAAATEGNKSPNPTPQK
ncbi:MAG: 50S ribosomal protein L25 [Microgenomates group bacterium]